MTMTGDVQIRDWQHKGVKPHRKQVFCLAWNMEGRRLASGSTDSTIRITRVSDSDIRIESGELKGPNEAVMSLEWHPTHPDKLASLSANDKNIRFWDVRTQKNTATVATAAANMSLAWTSDSHYMATTSVINKEEVVSIVDVRRMKVIHKYTNRLQVNNIAWTKDMRYFFEAVGSGEIEVYSYPDMKKLRGLHGHTTGVFAIALDRQQKYMATGGADAVACLWDLQDFICLRTFIKMDYPVRSMGFSYDSRYLAIAGEQPVLDLENIETGHSLGRLPLQSGADDLSWHPKQHMLAFPGEYGRDNVGEYGTVEFRWLPPSQLN